MRVIGLFLLSLSLAAPASGAESARGVLDGIRARQAGVRTVTASFRQEKTSALFGRPVRSAGTISLKFGTGVRWEYTDALDVIYDGRTLYLYYKELKVADRMEGEGAFAGPLAFDIDSILRDYDVVAEDLAGLVLLTLTPKREMPFERMEMEFASGDVLPGRVAVFEDSGDRTEIRFEDVRTNVTLKDALFRFTPPRGVEVREHEAVRGER
jgi:outer membrane lipoprotein-sorting protein